MLEYQQDNNHGIDLKGLMGTTQRSYLGLLLDQKHMFVLIDSRAIVNLVPSCIYKSAASLRIDDLNDDTCCLLVWRTGKSNVDPEYQPKELDHFLSPPPFFSSFFSSL